MTEGKKLKLVRLHNPQTLWNKEFTNNTILYPNQRENSKDEPNFNISTETLP